MNKQVLETFRSKYHTEASALKRIQFCKLRENKPRYREELYYLYAILGEIRTSNIHKMRTKTAYNNKKNKINRITHLTQRNRKYEENLKNFINNTELDVCGAPNDVKYEFYRFFFPYKRSTPTGYLNPISGFTKDVALTFIDTLIKAGHLYGERYYDIFDIFCRHRVTGKEFIRMYNNGVDSYKKLFPSAPPELLHKLYNIRQAGSKAVGNGEYLMKLKLKDTLDDDKNGDVCTGSGVNLEMKGDGGRLSCQTQSDVEACDESLKKDTFLNHGYSVLNHGMIHLYNIIKLNWGWNEKLQTGWTDQDIIRYFAQCKIKTYDKYLSQADKDLFVKDMADNWDAFFFDGQFNEKSVDWINACHDAFVYPRLEGFSHLKIDSRQPISIEKRKDFDVHFKVFHRDDFATPGLIIRLLETGAIIPLGTIKNNGRDNAVKVSIKY